MNLRRRIVSIAVGATLMLGVLAGPASAATGAHQFGGSWFCQWWFNNEMQVAPPTSSLGSSWWSYLNEFISSYCRMSVP